MASTSATSAAAGAVTAAIAQWVDTAAGRVGTVGWSRLAGHRQEVLLSLGAPLPATKATVVDIAVRHPGFGDGGAGVR